MAGRRASCNGEADGLRVPRPPVSIAVGHRAADYRNALERACVLRPQNPKAQSMNKPAQKLRCAVYTRKSSEEGLEQDFNSLDAQRDACVAFVTSQKAEGWLLLQDRYDDGGFSGNTLERPALRRL